MIMGEWNEMEKLDATTNQEYLYKQLHISDMIVMCYHNRLGSLITKNLKVDLFAVINAFKCWLLILTTAQ